MIDLRWKLFPLYVLTDNYPRGVRRVLQYKLPFGQWKDVPEFISPKDYAPDNPAWCQKCHQYHDDLRPNGPLETCPHDSPSAASHSEKP